MDSVSGDLALVEPSGSSQGGVVYHRILIQRFEDQVEWILFESLNVLVLL